MWLRRERSDLVRHCSLQEVGQKEAGTRKKDLDVRAQKATLGHCYMMWSSYLHSIIQIIRGLGDLLFVCLFVVNALLCGINNRGLFGIRAIRHVENHHPTLTTKHTTTPPESSSPNLQSGNCINNDMLSIIKIVYSSWLYSKYRYHSTQNVGLVVGEDMSHVITFRSVVLTNNSLCTHE